MIFVTVGTQLPFDRLIRCVDAWAAELDGREVFAQIGPGRYVPKRIGWARALTVAEFTQRVANASLVVAHAGMGSIITALEMGKPILVMPRRAEFGEHRNDHQLHTVGRFAEQGRIVVALDEKVLLQKLSRPACIARPALLQANAAPEFLSALRAFVDGDCAGQGVQLGKGSV